MYLKLYKLLVKMFSLTCHHINVIVVDSFQSKYMFHSFPISTDLYNFVVIPGTALCIFIIIDNGIIRG